MFIRGSFLSFLLCAGNAFAASCGIRFEEPKDHFENVDNRGFVYVIREVGRVDEKVPLYLIFHTAKGGNSPYGGRNFDIPLLESRLVPDNENQLSALMPNGWTWRFIKDAKNPGVYIGSSGWRGEYSKNGEVFSAWAECGGKIVFSKGRIQQFDDGAGRKFDYVYESNGSELREVTINGQKAVRVLREAVGSRDATGLDMPVSGQRIAFEREDRMIVSKVSGRNLITEQIPALSKVEINNSIIQSVNNSIHIITYAFAQDNDGNPTIEVVTSESNGARPAAASNSSTTNNSIIQSVNNSILITWDSATGKILRDSKGDWRYDKIEAPDDPWAYAALGRTNGKGQKEFWHLDRQNGEETTMLADGTKKFTSRFTSGPLANMVRLQEETTPDGKTRIFNQPFYDESARVIRRIVNDRMENYRYDDKNRLVERIDEAGKTIWKKEFDDQGRVAKEIFEDKMYTFRYLDNGAVKRLTHPPGDQKTFTRRDTFDTQGRLVEYFTRGDTYNILYDAAGRREKLLLNGVLNTLTVYDEATGRKIREVAYSPGGELFHVKDFPLDGSKAVTTLAAQLAPALKNELDRLSKK